MRKRKFAAVLVLVCFMSGTAFGGNMPYIPDMQDTKAAASPVVASMRMILNTPSMNLASRLSVSPSSFRGNFGEALMRNYYSMGGDLSASKTWYMLEHGGFAFENGRMFYSPGKEQGFDGLFIQFDKKGNPSGVMVAESKFGKTQLGMTSQSGRQMSDTWVKHRASVASLRYESIANDIQKNGIKFTTLYPSSNQVTEIPLPNKTTALMWQENGQYWLYSKNGNVNAADIQHTLRKTAQMLKGVADGKINARKILFHVDAANQKFEVTVHQLDSNGSEIPGTKQVIKTMSGAYSSLPAQEQEIIKRSVVEAIRLQKYHGIPEAVGMKKAARDFDTAVKKGKVAEYVQKYNLEKTNFAWKEAGNTALTAGLYGGALVLVFSAVPKIWSAVIDGADFDYTGLAKDVGLGFASASIGTAAGIGMNYLLQTSSQEILTSWGINGLQGVLSGTVSGVVASAIFSYGRALLSGGSFRDGNRMMITGTAATLGGTLAGYVIGSTILATGGSVAVGMAIAAVCNYGWSLLDENSRNERLQSLIGAYGKY